jgi:hypothetical protein
MTNEEFQRRVLDFQDRTGSDLAALKTQMVSLVGKEKPGRIDKIEADVAQLQAAHNQRRGAAHVLELGIGFLGGLLGGWLRHHA